MTSELKNTSDSSEVQPEITQPTMAGDYERLQEDHHLTQAGRFRIKYSAKNFTPFSVFTFRFLNKVIYAGNATLDFINLTPLYTKFSAKYCSERIDRLFRKRLKREPGPRSSSQVDSTDDTAVLFSDDDELQSKVSMISVVFGAFWQSILLSFVIQLIQCFAVVAPAYILGLMIDFITSDEPMATGFYLTAALFGAQLIISFTTAHLYRLTFNLALQESIGFSSLIYQKSLRLSPASFRKYPSGDIINIVSVDIQNIISCMIMGSVVFACPLTLALIFGLIYTYLGVYSFMGLAVIGLFGPVAGVVTKLESMIQDKQMKKKDERVAALTEIFNTIKILKLYAWEKSFIRKVEFLRKQEARLMYIYVLVCSVFSFVWNCLPFLIAGTVIGSYLLLNKENELSPKKVLVSIALFSQLRYQLAAFPYVISLLVKMSVSLKRIKEFLLCEEVDTTAVTELVQEDESVNINNATFKWNLEEEKPPLANINLSIKNGELFAVVGKVAAGKSSLIQAILGELYVTSGSVNRRNAKVAYVPQQAWILNDTIRNNILFGKDYNPSLYKMVLKKCCLMPDLRILPAGDKTEIGEKGVNLSGGQKQRVSLARAVYQEAEIYLLDDPLSAVDAHVAQALFQDIIGPNGMLAKTSRILVTHTLSLLPKVDRLAILEDSTVAHVGKYEDFVNRPDISLSQYITQGDSSVEVKDDGVGEAKEKVGTSSEAVTSRKRTSSTVSRDSLKREISQLDNNDGRIIEDEEAQTGNVKWSVYGTLLWRFGLVSFFLTLTAYAVYRWADIGSVYYITEWSSTHTANVTQPEAIEFLKYYAIFGGVEALATFITYLWLSLRFVAASTTLHNKMLNQVLRAPMSFFDTTPSGRIINRFSRDMDQLDMDLSQNTDGFIDTFVAFVSIIIIVAYNLPVFLAVLAPLILVYYYIQQFYMGSSRQVKRLNAVSKSPVLNSYQESISGTSSIRAYQSHQMFTHKNMSLLDVNQNCSFHEYNGYRWLAIRLDFMGNLMDCAVFALLTYNRGSINANIAGLLLTYSLQASSALTWIVRLSAQVENTVVAAERVIEYTKTKGEADWDEGEQVPASWPSEGAVSFGNYSTRYRENQDPVLRNVNVEIKRGEKVGIVGRTGAGKSSLTLALLRIIEADEGHILIDGINIALLPLHTLRSRVAMIPQDPVLFKGTMRYNIDPEDKYSDEQIWSALKRAHLDTENKPIHFEVEEGGANLSVGERQLVCLSRAILRDAKVLILDEATAAVDLATDALIQTTIRHSFKQCTVITIAHRLHTIIDYDKIVVLDKGEVVEVGAPKELLEIPDGWFASMANDADISG